jgi:hypothetical protein
VKSARHKGRRRSPKPQKKPASTAQSPLHKHILRQFRYPLNVHDVLAGHIGDDWEEFLLKGEKRVVGWQWLDGYARRVMKSPSTMFSVRPLLRTEELALEKAGLQLDHEDGMGGEGGGGCVILTIAGISSNGQRVIAAVFEYPVGVGIVRQLSDDYLILPL